MVSFAIAPLSSYISGNSEDWSSFLSFLSSNNDNANIVNYNNHTGVYERVSSVGIYDILNCFSPDRLWSKDIPAPAVSPHTTLIKVDASDMSLFDHSNIYLWYYDLPALYKYHDAVKKLPDYGYKEEPQSWWQSAMKVIGLDGNTSDASCARVCDALPDSVDICGIVGDSLLAENG